MLCGSMTSNTEDFGAMPQRSTLYAAEFFTPLCDWQLIYLSVKPCGDAVYLRDAGQGIMNIELSEAYLQLFSLQAQLGAYPPSFSVSKL